MWYKAQRPVGSQPRTLIICRGKPHADKIIESLGLSLTDHVFVDPFQASLGRKWEKVVSIGLGELAMSDPSFNERQLREYLEWLPSQLSIVGKIYHL